MQTIGRQPQRAPDSAPVHDEWSPTRGDHAVLTGAAARRDNLRPGRSCRRSPDLRQFVKDEFDVFFECGVLAHRFGASLSGAYDGNWNSA